MRLEAVTECEHGSPGSSHDKWSQDTGIGRDCPGGSRREASTSELIEELFRRQNIEASNDQKYEDA